MALFSAADRTRIEARIKVAESRSAGEIVVAAVARSDDYATRRWLCALAMTLASSAVIGRLFPALGLDWLLLMQLPLALLYFPICGLSVVIRWLVPKAERDAAVAARAARMFTDRRIFATREGTGVLIMLSEQERRVTILADQGIDDLIHQEGWQRHVGRIVQSIREKRAADGVCAVLDALDGVLAEAFPPRADDVNELPNHVVEER